MALHNPPPKHLQIYARRGRVYCYYRRRGHPLVLLPPRDTPPFYAAYAAAHAAAEERRRPSPLGAVACLPGSMGALIASYRDSPEWRGLKPTTRTDYNKALDPLAARYGTLHVGQMPRQFVFKLRDEYARKPAMTRGKHPVPILDGEGAPVILDTPRRANRVVNTLRLLLAWALDRGGWVKSNVAVGVGGLALTGGGYRMWQPGEVAALLASAPEPIRRAAVLALATGQRKQDCLAMLRTDRADGWITVTPIKTEDSSGVRLAIPEHPDLTAALDTAPTSGAPTILTRADGKPWGEDHFNHAFADAVKGAGLAGLSFHGLRKTASGWLAEAGATDAEIDAILGHVDPKMTRLYRRQADQRIRAEAAMGKLATRRIV